MGTPNVGAGFGWGEAAAEPRSRQGRICDGFRMPANADLSTGTRAGVRKPPKNETAGTRAPGGSACAMENWLAPLPGHGPEDVGTAVDASDGHEN